MSKWQKIEDGFLGWLAGTATGSFVKVVLGAVLAYIAANIGDWEMPPVLAVAITAGVPVLINVFNPLDGRYGLGKSHVEIVE